MLLVIFPECQKHPICFDRDIPNDANSAVSSLNYKLKLNIKAAYNLQYESCSVKDRAVYDLIAQIIFKQNISLCKLENIRNNIEKETFNEMGYMEV